MAFPFSDTQALFSPNVPPYFRRLFLMSLVEYGGTIAQGLEAANFCVVESVEDEVYIKRWYRNDLRVSIHEFYIRFYPIAAKVVVQELVFEVVRGGAEHFCYQDYAVAISPKTGHVVAASEVFDFSNQESSINDPILRKPSPPSPYSPRPRIRPAPLPKEKSKGDRKRRRGESPPRGAHIIDLTGDDEDVEMEDVRNLLVAKQEEQPILPVSPRKKVRMHTMRR
ncbi:hypothetical protein R3P38DRAFT_3438396 [Favolaschia claudopus]|uniref:Uncharacterized protein n=1 Tax=Favolaschia claudopus TaxID=2862362 RepID=A0AAV9ZSN7_9AGAR